MVEGFEVKCGRCLLPIRDEKAVDDPMDGVVHQVARQCLNRLTEQYATEATRFRQEQDAIRRQLGNLQGEINRLRATQDSLAEWTCVVSTDHVRVFVPDEEAEDGDY